MMTRPKIDMVEATRLTRQGRLKEAMAVLREHRSAGQLPHPTIATLGRNRSKADRTASTWCHPPLRRETPWTAPRAGEGSTPLSARVDSKCPPPPSKYLDAFRKFIPAGIHTRSTKHAANAVPTASVGLFEEYSFANEVGMRKYKLYVPRHSHGEALPLVVMLHGCTQSPDDFAIGTRMNELAEEQRFMVAYPAQPQSANPSKCWNWFSVADQRRDHGEPSLIAGITRQIIRDFPVELGRVYVAGLSAGGATAAIMGAAYPDLYAAVGVHSGLACGAAHDVTTAFIAMRRGGPEVRAGKAGTIVPTIVFHGDADRTVNPANGDQVIAQAKGGASLTATVVNGKAPGGISYDLTVQTDGTGRSVLEQWVLHGVGHAWSGGSEAGSYTEPRGPDASREMVRFFRQHSPRSRAL